MEKVSREIAEKDVTFWLDKKKISTGHRELNENFIDQLADAVQEGNLVLDKDTNEWTYELAFPVNDEKGGEALGTLKFKSRLNDVMLRPFLNGVKNDDADGRLLAHTAALTGANKGLLKLIDSVDKRVVMAITVFFV